MLQTEIMPASLGQLLAAWGIVSAEGAHFGLLFAAFTLGALTSLALIAAGKSFKAGAALTTSPRNSLGDPALAACIGPAILAAIRTGELQLHYQPKLDARTMKVCGAEALSRWTLPDGTALLPEEFVKHAEALGGIRELTVWGVEQALRDSEKLASRSLGGPIFVNLSGKLICAEFVGQLIEIIGSHSARIGFEITETAVLENPEEALDCLHMLRGAGIQLAIDDYGAGLSSLTYLKQIPAGELKIDRKFIQGMIRSNRDPLIVRSTIDLCHGLGMTVTAEGVEDAMTASLLRVMGCDTIQGFYVSKAVGVDELLRFIEDHSISEPIVPQISKIVNHSERS